MSAARLRLSCRILLILLIFVSTTLCSQVVWKNRGDSITVQCKSDLKDALSVSLKKGLNKDSDVFHKSKSSPKTTFQDPSRCEMHGVFPNFDILLKNLTISDTGVYWCLYRKISNKGMEIQEGQGSVLLIVTEKVSRALDAVAEPCSSPSPSLVVTSVAVSALVLLLIFITVLLAVAWRVKRLSEKKKPRPAPLQNDVYEEMRGTIRRS